MYFNSTEIVYFIIKALDFSVLDNEFVLFCVGFTCLVTFLWVLIEIIEKLMDVFVNVLSSAWRGLRVLISCYESDDEEEDADAYDIVKDLNGYDICIKKNLAGPSSKYFKRGETVKSEDGDQKVTSDNAKEEGSDTDEEDILTKKDENQEDKKGKVEESSKSQSNTPESLIPNGIKSSRLTVDTTIEDELRVNFQLKVLGWSGEDGLYKKEQVL